MKKQNILKNIKAITFYVMIAAVGLTGAACGKKDKNTTAMGPYYPGGIPGAPGSPIGGAYLTSAMGTDGTAPTVILEVDFFSQTAQPYDPNMGYNGLVGLSGIIRIPAYPVGCPSLAMYGPGAIIPVQGQGNLYGTLFSNVQLMGPNGPIGMLNGRLRPAPGTIGVDGRMYSYRLDSELYTQSCVVWMN